MQPLWARMNFSSRHEELAGGPQMRIRTFALLATLALLPALPYAQTQKQSAATPTATGYLMPPKVIVDMLDAPATPGVVVSQDHRTIALLERRSMPTIADLAQPIHRI